MSTGAKSRQSTSMYPNLLYVEIPLGIFITNPSYIDEKGCELLLHYSATGGNTTVEKYAEESQCLCWSW